MRNIQPLVSVIICNYNYSQYIGEAIESVLNQTHKNIELIIVDDGSIDDSREVIKGFVEKHPAIRYFRQSNKGIVATRNYGMRLAKGDFLCFLDSDDYFDHDYIENFLKFAIKNNTDIVYGDSHMFSDDGKISKKSIFPDYLPETLKAVNIINICSLVKTKVAHKQSFDAHLNRQSHEDWDFFLGLALSGAKIAHLKGNYLHYRIKPDSRNNFRTIQQYQKTYNYVVDKYSKKYPQEFAEINQNWEREREIGLQGVQIYVARLNIAIAEKDVAIAQKEEQLSSILSSASYKIGRTITAPIRAIKKVLRR